MNQPVSTLSEVFPQGTVYFYGFPAGRDSGFLNGCPAAGEEVVAARPTVCAGSGVRVVTYANTVSEAVWGALKDDLGVELVSRDQLVILPAEIDGLTDPSERNCAIKAALLRQVPDGQFTMAQPFMDPELRSKYLVRPEVTHGLNDKKNLLDCFPARHLVPTLGEYNSGADFAAADSKEFDFRSVVKVSSSSAGDGVRVCDGQGDFKSAQERFRNIDGDVLVQKYINKVAEWDVKFCIKEDGTIEFTGFSEELTGPNGEYFGGVIFNQPDETGLLERIRTVLRDEVLPKVREKGWVGVGAVDVLIDAEGNFYFSDPNFRMTATLAQTLQSNTGRFGKQSVLNFNGGFQGTLPQFLAALGSVARAGEREQLLNVVAASPHDGLLTVHAGVLFDEQRDLMEKVEFLRAAGLNSDIFAHSLVTPRK